MLLGLRFSLCQAHGASSKMIVAIVGLYFTVSPFPYMLNGDSGSAYLVCFLPGMKELAYETCFKWTWYMSPVAIIITINLLHCFLPVSCVPCFIPGFHYFSHYPFGCTSAFSG